MALPDYWSAIPWAWLIGPGGFVAAVGAPYILKRLEGKAQLSQAQRQDIAAERERSDKISAQQFEREQNRANQAQADADRYRSLLKAEEDAHDATRRKDALLLQQVSEDRDHGWNKARAVYELYREGLHTTRNARHRLNIRRWSVLKAADSPDCALVLRALLSEWREEEGDQQSPLLLDEMPEKSADEFRYLPRQETP